MPDDCPRSKANPLAGLLEAPANVHVVARLAVLCIEAVDDRQGVAPERHVAAGDVFGYLVALQNMGRLSRRGRHARRQPAVLGGQVGAADRCGSRAMKLVDEVREPGGVGEAVRVGVGHNRTCGRAQADIAGIGQAMVFLMNGTHPGKAGENVPRGIRRAVVHDDDLVVRVVERQQRAQALVQGPRPVVAANDDGDTRRFRKQRCGRLFEQLAQSMIGCLGRAIRTRDAERPVVDRVAAGVPFISPGEGE